MALLLYLGCENCPHGTLSFGLAHSGGSSGNDINIVLNSNYLKEVTKIKWIKGEKPVPDILNEKEVKSKLLE